MKQSKKPSRLYEHFVSMDTSQYCGEWIAISEKKVIAHGKKADVVYRKAKRLAHDKPISLAKAPDSKTLVLHTNT